MNNSTIKLLEIVYYKENVSSKELAKYYQVSERTIRNKINDARLELRESGISISSKPNVGYYIEDGDKEKAFQIIQCEKEFNFVPDNKEDRISTIILMLLWHDDYVKFELLSDALYVSSNTLSLDFKIVLQEIKKYNLKLERRPNYGIKLVGSEFDKRACYINFLEGDDNYLDKVKGILKHISKILKNVSNEYDFYIPTNNFKSIVLLIHVIAIRQKQACFIKFSDEEKNDLSISTSLYTLNIAKRIIGSIEDIKESEDELLYLAINLNGKIYPKNIKSGPKDEIINMLINQMLDTIKDTSGIDLYDDLKLRNDLLQHIEPLLTRIKYNISSINPILETIKTKYSYAYILASNACRVLNDYFKKEVSQDEIGYFAVFIALALERKPKEINKKNIVVVCASGRATSQLLISKCEQYFGKYINKIYECNLYELPSLDFKKLNISFIFSTININEKLPVPYYVVSPFLDDNDYTKYKYLFKDELEYEILKYFDPNLFMVYKGLNTKEEVLKKMCDHLANYKDIPSDYYEQVIKRENAGITDFGNLVAIPHAYKSNGNDKYVMVAILDKPIFWGHNDVQIIFLISLPENKDSSVDEFCKLILNFQANKKYINQALENKTYENLISILFKAYKAK